MPVSQTQFDRATHHRSDNSWISKASEAPDAQYLVFNKGRVLIQNKHLAWQKYASEFKNTPSVFLGIRNSTPCFAISMADPYPLENARHMDTRRIGPQLSPSDLSILCQAQSMLHWHHTVRFCERCGQSLNPSLAGDKRKCISCHQEYFPRLNPVVIMLVEWNEQLLLGRQPQFPTGMFSCLAGFVEPGETIENAVIREVLEETQVTTKDVRYIDSQAWPFPAQLMIGCIAQATSSTIQTDDELEDARWFSRSDISQMLDFSHPKRYTIPPSIAIAHQLIQGWYSRDSHRP